MNCAVEEYSLSRCCSKSQKCPFECTNCSSNYCENCIIKCKSCFKVFCRLCFDDLLEVGNCGKMENLDYVCEECLHKK